MTARKPAEPGTARAGATIRSENELPILRCDRSMSRKRRALLGGGLIAIVLLAAAWWASGLWSGGAPPAPANVILISIDSLRPDHLGAYGYARDTSPYIDALATEAVLFEDAVSTSSWTLPAHISLLSSLPPLAHGVDRGGRRLAEAAPLISEVFQQAGWATVGLVSGPFLDRRFGYDRGWDVYDDQTLRWRNPKASHSGVTSPRFHRRALELLDEALAEESPLFLFLHYWDVHYDYEPPPPYDTLFDPGYRGTVDGKNFVRNPQIHAEMDARDLDHLVALYDGEIRWVDHHLGLLFDALRERGLYEGALIVVTTDHGDEFLEHGRFGHRHNLHDSTLRVPLIIKYPRGWKGGARIKRTVSLLDVAPTLLAATGLTPPASFVGVDLSSPGHGSLDDSETVRFAHLFKRSHGDDYVVVGGRHKLLRREPHEGGAATTWLYDRRAEPAEGEDVADEWPDRVRRYGRLHSQWRRMTEELGSQLQHGEFEYSEELSDELEALGYL